MTTYAAFSNLSSPTGSIYHRKPSTASSVNNNNDHHDTTTVPMTPHNTITSTAKESREKGKWYNFLLPAEEPTLSPGLIYDPVIRRPLFSSAPKGNERTLRQVQEQKRTRLGASF